MPHSDYNGAFLGVWDGLGGSVSGGVTSSDPGQRQPPPDPMRGGNIGSRHRASPRANRRDCQFFSPVLSNCFLQGEFVATGVPANMAVSYLLDWSCKNIHCPPSRKNVSFLVPSIISAMGAGQRGTSAQCTG